MADVKYNPSHHAGKNAEERIANRLKGSGVPGQGGSVQTGTGPNRTISYLHESGAVGAHGGPRSGPVPPRKDDGR
jgi:hypothetical protein